MPIKYTHWMNGPTARAMAKVVNPNPCPEPEDIYFSFGRSSRQQNLAEHIKTRSKPIMEVRDNLNANQRKIVSACGMRAKEISSRVVDKYLLRELGISPTSRQLVIIRNKTDKAVKKASCIFSY